MTEATAEVEAPTGPSFEDEFQEMSFKQLESLTIKRNNLVGTANAANGNRVDLTEQLTEESDDPEIVAAREARDEANELLAKLVGPKVDAILSDASEGLGGIEEQIKEIDSKLKPGLTYYKKVYTDGSEEFLPKQTRLKGMSISNSGSGGRRVRGFYLTVTIDGKVEDFENFATAAKWIDVDTVDLQNAFFAAAGNPDKVKDAPDKVSFTVTFTDTDEDENEISRTASCLAYRPDADEATEAE